MSVLLGDPAAGTGATREARPAACAPPTVVAVAGGRGQKRLRMTRHNLISAEKEKTALLAIHCASHSLFSFATGRTTTGNLRNEFLIASKTVRGRGRLVTDDTKAFVGAAGRPGSRHRTA